MKFPRAAMIALVGWVIGVFAWLPPSASGKDDAARRAAADQLCGTHAHRELEAVARGTYHESLRKSRAARAGRGSFEAAAAASSVDVGDVAVLQDDGTLIALQNLFDLGARSFRFEPGLSGQYGVFASTASVDAGSGTAIPLADDDSREVTLGFEFPFFGSRYAAVFVNSDGNLTFTGPDTSSESRDLARFAYGPPRIGPLFVDLDPTGASVIFRQEQDGIVFAWDRVPRYGTQDPNTFSVKLFRDGRIEFAYGLSSTLDAVVGISPGGGAGGISGLDFSAGLPASALAGTIAEVFSAEVQLIETAIARMFLRTHPDEFDQLIVFLDFSFSFQGAFAYELNVANSDGGIGLPVMDSAASYGSGGRLKSFVMMGSLSGTGRFPMDPTVEFFRTYNSLEILAHEVGHRWLAYSALREGGGDNTNLLWPTDLAHWSFYFNADASVMEGNRIEDRGAGLGSQRFLTVAATNRYSALDRYLMGFESPAAVPDMFYVANPTIPRPPSSIPSIGVAFGGTRRDFSVQQIVAANQERKPSALQSQKVHRQAFVLVTRAGQQPAASQISKLQAMRDAWIPYFNEQTGFRAWAVTGLQSSPGTTPRAILFPFMSGGSRRYTGIALANWGTTPADVNFTGYGNDGTLLAQPEPIVNPRMLTIAPGAQVALLDAQILGIPVDAPHAGWGIAESSSSQVTGFFLEGDIDQTILDGAVAGNEPSDQLFFTRVRLEADPGPIGTRRNLLSIINPGAAAADVTLRLIDPQGNVRGTARRTLAPRGRLAEEIPSLFPDTSLLPFSGYIAVGCNQALAGYQSIESDMTVMSLPAQPAGAAPTLYSAQFASGRAGDTAYFTDINLINTAAGRRTVRLQLFDNSGSPVAGIRNPVSVTLEPGMQVQALGDAIFGLPDPALGGLVEGSLVVSCDAPGVIGDVSFGDPVNRRFLAGLPLDGRPVSNMVFSQVAQGSTGAGKPYFTGIALHNPNSAGVLVNLEVYSESGARTGAATILLGGGGRVSRTLPELVPSISRQIRGYVRVSAIGGPVVGFELFGSQYLDFLAAVPPQPINP